MKKICKFFNRDNKLSNNEHELSIGDVFLWEDKPVLIYKETLKTYRVIYMVAGGCFSTSTIQKRDILGRYITLYEHTNLNLLLTTLKERVHKYNV